MYVEGHTGEEKLFSLRNLDVEDSKVYFKEKRIHVLWEDEEIVNVEEKLEKLELVTAEPEMLVMEKPMMCGGVMENTSDLGKAQEAADRWRSRVEQDLGKTFTEYKVVSEAHQSTWHIRVQTDQGKYSLFLEEVFVSVNECN
jgi:hypothetical protein